MNVNSRNMFSLSGCSWETNFPDRYSFVKWPGRQINVDNVWKNLESHMNALFRYSLTNPAIVGVLLVASCPQTWQYIPLSSEPQFRQFAYGMLSCMLLAFDFCLFLPILLSFGITCHVMWCIYLQSYWFVWHDIASGEDKLCPWQGLFLILNKSYVSLLYYIFCSIRLWKCHWKYRSKLSVSRLLYISDENSNMYLPDDGIFIYLYVNKY